MATTSAGNAFVPRLYADAKIAELERGGGEVQKAAGIDLSKRFAVASRFTSLLVLESEGMFKAFGLDRSSIVPAFAGEEQAESSSFDAEGEERENDLTATGQGFGSGHGRRASQSSTRAPGPFFNESLEQHRRRRMVPMKRVFDRNGTFEAGNYLARQSAAKLVVAESALSSTPDSRDRTIDLYALYSTSGRIGKAQKLTARWSGRDALDPDALTARADLAARQGDRDRAIRILGGLADVRSSDADAPRGAPRNGR